MNNKYVAPEHHLDAFNCPLCDAYSKQNWYQAALYSSRGGYSDVIPNLDISICTRCDKYSVWLDKKMLFPIGSIAPLPSEDMPNDVKEDFIEARNVVNISPKASCALLRLSIQKLMKHLGGEGKNLNEAIGNLVKKGLSGKIQKALDSVRVIGNNAVHPGEIDLKDDAAVAISIFSLVNMIVEVMITQPKRVDEIFKKIPEGAREAIEKRNKNK